MPFLAPLPPPIFVASVQQYRQVEQFYATQTLIPVEIVPGRATIIDFLNTDETILDIFLADLTRITYTTDTDTQKKKEDAGSWKATAIYLRVIEPISFPGLTKAATSTNLLVTTIDGKGQRHRYNFSLSVAQTPTYLGVKIISSGGKSGNILGVDGHPLSGYLVERGLHIAIDKQYTQSNDPIVQKVSLWVQRVRAGKDPMEVARDLKINIQVLQTLAKLAQEQKMRGQKASFK